MNDPFDIRIRSFVVELLDDPPVAPPFPQPGTVVVGGDRTAGDQGSKKLGNHDADRRWSRGPMIAAGAFAAIVLIGAVVSALAYLTDGAERQPVAGSDSAVGVVGLTFDTIDGPGTEPDKIVFNEDGTFRVVDQFRNVDSGVYTTNGDEITFESDAMAHEPTSDVRWFHDPALNINNNTCDGVVGTYRVVWETSTRFILFAISDPCPRRISVARGLTFELDAG